MEPIGAGLCHHIYNTAKNGAEFRRVGVRNHFELLDGVNDRRHGIGAQKSRKVVHAIGQEVIAPVGCAVNRRKRKCRAFSNRSSKTACTATHAVLTDADGCDTRSQRKQLCKVAAVQWKVIDLFCGNNCAKFCGGNLQLLGCGFDADYFCLRAGCQ